MLEIWYVNKFRVFTFSIGQDKEPLFEFSDTDEAIIRKLYEFVNYILKWVTETVHLIVLYELAFFLKNSNHPVAQKMSIYPQMCVVM